MLTYAVEVCALIGATALCLAIPVVLIGIGIEAVRTVRARTQPMQEAMLQVSEVPHGLHS